MTLCAVGRAICAFHASGSSDRRSAHRIDTDCNFRVSFRSLRHRHQPHRFLDILRTCKLPPGIGWKIFRHPPVYELALRCHKRKLHPLRNGHIHLNTVSIFDRRQRTPRLTIGQCLDTTHAYTQFFVDDSCWWRGLRDLAPGIALHQCASRLSSVRGLVFNQCVGW